MNFKLRMAETLGLTCTSYDPDHEWELKGNDRNVIFYFGNVDFVINAGTPKQAWEQAADRVIDKLHELISESM